MSWRKEFISYFRSYRRDIARIRKSHAKNREVRFGKEIGANAWGLASQNATGTVAVCYNPSYSPGPFFPQVLGTEAEGHQLAVERRPMDAEYTGGLTDVALGLMHDRRMCWRSTPRAA
jgi:hypothetical protein